MTKKYEETKIGRDPALHKFLRTTAGRDLPNEFGALKKMEPKEMVPFLKTLSKNKDPDARRKLVDFLNRSGSKWSENLLIKMVNYSKLSIFV